MGSDSDPKKEATLGHERRSLLAKRSTRVQRMPMKVSATRQLHRSSQGFTLMEVMIVVAIVAILAAIALPSYTDYVRRGKLPEAFTGLSDYKIKMEQYYQDNRNYGVGACADVNGPQWNTFVTSGSKYFTFTCGPDPVNGFQGFVLTATSNAAVGSSHVYTLTSANAKGTTAFKGAAVNQQGWCVTSATGC